MMNKTGVEYADYSWNPIPQCPGYYASVDGRIVSMKRHKPKIMKPQVSRDGYLYVLAYTSGKMKKLWVHVAVLSAFVRQRDVGEECRHLDDNPKNNSLENLAWGTRLENVNDKRMHGRLPIGEQVVGHKLTIEQALEIRKQYSKFSLRQLAKMYHVSHTCIRRAAIGIRWAHIGKAVSA